MDKSGEDPRTVDEVKAPLGVPQATHARPSGLPARNFLARVGVTRGRARVEPSDSRSDGLAERPADDIEHLLDVAVCVALLGSGLDAALNVVFEYQQGH